MNTATVKEVAQAQSGQASDQAIAWHERKAKEYRQYFWFWMVLGWVLICAAWLYWLIVGSLPLVGSMLYTVPPISFVLAFVWWFAARNDQKKANELKPPLAEDTEGTSHG